MFHWLMKTVISHKSKTINWWVVSSLSFILQDWRKRFDAGNCDKDARRQNIDSQFICMWSACYRTSFLDGYVCNFTFHSFLGEEKPYTLSIHWSWPLIRWPQMSLSVSMIYMIRYDLNIILYWKFEVSKSLADIIEKQLSFIQRYNIASL